MDAIDDSGSDTDVYYYVSLGTSLSVGVQPTSSGVLFTSDDGYPDQLFDLIKADFEAGGANRELRLVKLGCPGETLDDMINGGVCPYVAGSQLDAGVDFLRLGRDSLFQSRVAVAEIELPQVVQVMNIGSKKLIM